MLEKIKQFLKNNEKDIVLITGVILISLISFGAGRFFSPGIPKAPIIFEKMPLESSISNITANQKINQEASGQQLEANGQEECLLVASKNSDKYHYPWCSGAKNISEKNKICFQSKEEAQSRGYQPAANCPGL